MKKLPLTVLVLLISLLGFGQYGKQSEESLFLTAIGGILVLITMVVIWVIASRIKKTINLQKHLIKTQTLTAIAMGAIKGRTCVKCSDTHEANLTNCPNCGISYKKSRVILKYNNVIDSYSREFYEKNKDNTELLWEYINEKK